MRTGKYNITLVLYRLVLTDKIEVVPDTDKRAEIMKRITILLLSVMSVVATYGQNNDERGKEIYIFVSVAKSTNEATARIDFGDGSPVMVFTDDKGKKRKFETIFEPINLLVKDGWEIDKFSSMLQNGMFTNLITHWVMRKKVNEESEVKEGMKLIKE